MNSPINKISSNSTFNYGGVHYQALDMHQRINANIKHSSEFTKQNVNISNVSPASRVAGDSSDLATQLDDSHQFGNNYLLNQKLQSKTTFSKMKSSIVFQNEFLSHIRLNSLK